MNLKARVDLRLTAADLAAWKRAAAHDRMPLTVWLRSLVRRELERRQRSVK